MKRLAYRFVAMALMGLLMVNSTAFGQAQSTPKVTYNVRMPSSGIATEFELVHLIQDFAPGAATAVHTHGGQGLALVLDGELTQRMDGQPDKVYKVGETFLETPGVYFSVANASAAPARLSVAFLLPKGATLTTPQQPSGTPTATPPPAPKVTYNVRMASPAIPGEFELVHLIQDFVPGAATVVHTHGGHGLALVLDGELTQRIPDSAEKVYKVGETFLETPGVYFSVANASAAPARLSVAFLLPKGATLTTPLQPAATPTVTQNATVVPTVVISQPTIAPMPEPSAPTPSGMPRTGSVGIERLWLPALALALLCLAMSGAIRLFRMKVR